MQTQMLLLVVIIISILFILYVSDNNEYPSWSLGMLPVLLRGYVLDAKWIYLFTISGNDKKIIGRYPVPCHRIHSVDDLFAREKFSPPDLLPNIETLDARSITDTIASLIPGINNKGIKKIKVRAKYDGKIYTVRDFPNHQEAAEILARLNADAEKLIDYLNRNFPNDPHTIALNKNYNGDLEEETPKNLENLTSYTLDKEKIVSCLRTKSDGNNIHDYNLLLYVFVHEMSHMANDRSYGHDANFDRSFEFMLQRATELGILKRIDFEKNPQNFCGLPITVNVDY